MTGKRVCYTLDSTLDSVDRAERNSARSAREAGFAEEQVCQVSMAVREAMINAVLHGNRYDPGKKIELRLECRPQALVVSIRDQGEGLDVAHLPDPLAPERLLQPSGRGVILMRAFMDEVRIHSSPTGTEIIMIKKLGGPAAEPKEKAQ